MHELVEAFTYSANLQEGPVTAVKKAVTAVKNAVGKAKAGSKDKAAQAAYKMLAQEIIKGLYTCVFTKKAKELESDNTVRPSLYEKGDKVDLQKAKALLNFLKNLEVDKDLLDAVEDAVESGVKVAVSEDDKEIYEEALADLIERLSADDTVELVKEADKLLGTTMAKSDLAKTAVEVKRKYEVPEEEKDLEDKPAEEEEKEETPSDKPKEAGAKDVLALFKSDEGKNLQALFNAVTKGQTDVDLAKVFIKNYNGAEDKAAYLKSVLQYL